MNLLFKGFRVFVRRHFLARNRRFGTTCLSHQRLEEILEKMSGAREHEPIYEYNPEDGLNGQVRPFFLAPDIWISSIP
jgi:hypothetical protein